MGRGEVGGAWEGEEFFEHGWDAVEGCYRVGLEGGEDGGSGEGGRGEEESAAVGVACKEAEDEAETASWRD